MTDYFTQWCVPLELETMEEFDWVREMLQKLRRFSELSESTFEEGDPELGEIEELKKDLGELVEIVQDNHDYLTFTPKFEVVDGVGDVYFDADEVGDPDQITRFCQAFLKKFRPQGSLSIEWAYTCSRSQSDGYGGGAAFITAEKIELLDTRNWLYEKEQEFEKK